MQLVSSSVDESASINQAIYSSVGKSRYLLHVQRMKAQFHQSREYPRLMIEGGGVIRLPIALSLRCESH